jgi:predicted AAA+ superfamily ATPase
MSFITRHFIPPNESFFLFGPRGTGKSTALRMLFPETALWIDLLDPVTLRSYSAKPERLKEAVYASSNQHIIIDEIQKAPELLGVVHSLIEEKRGWHFILTGSSARKLKRTGVNLLGGRAVKRSLHPFMASELKQKFHLNEALQIGTLPLVLSSLSPKDILDAYASLYLNEEVKAEGMVRHIGHFTRFLEIMSFSHGSILNLSNVARECEVSRKTVEGYLGVLEDLLLCFMLPVFTKRAKRMTVHHPKFYYFDTGIYQSLRPRGPLDRTEEISGAALEGLVMQHLRAWNDYRDNTLSLYYWRTQTGIEVDFIIYGEKEFWAIEVKHSKQVFTKDLRGLQSFINDYPEATPILLYRGNERLLMNGILCLPVESFLVQLNPDESIEV